METWEKLSNGMYYYVCTNEDRYGPFRIGLGWEPSMEYVCDKWHLEWKLRQVESALRETSAYRRMLNLHKQ